MNVVDAVTNVVSTIKGFFDFAVQGPITDVEGPPRTLGSLVVPNMIDKGVTITTGGEVEGVVAYKVTVVRAAVPELRTGVTTMGGSEVSLRVDAR